MIEVAIVLLVGFALVSASAGMCWLCTLFIDETVPERGYVKDVEHDSTGVSLTGWRLYGVRIAEMIFNPICAPINKWLGRID